MLHCCISPQLQPVGRHRFVLLSGFWGSGQQIPKGLDKQIPSHFPKQFPSTFPKQFPEPNSGESRLVMVGFPVGKCFGKVLGKCLGNVLGKSFGKVLGISLTNQLGINLANSGLPHQGFGVVAESGGSGDRASLLSGAQNAEAV